MIRIVLRDQFRTIPQTTGVYLLKNKKNMILYAGKAKNLRTRVMQYLQKGPKTLDSRMEMLQKEIYSVQVIELPDELQALLQEDYLIKKHHPPYNIRQKESQRRYYLHLIQSDFPSLVSINRIHDPIQEQNGKFWGPFRDSYHIEHLIDLIILAFPIRKCTTTVPQGKCMRAALNQCTGPCFGTINKKEYAMLVQQACAFLDGNLEPWHQTIETKMNTWIADRAFEKCRQVQNQIPLAQRFTKRQRFGSLFKNKVLVLQSNTSPAGYHVFSNGKFLYYADGLFVGDSVQISQLLTEQKKHNSSCYSDWELEDRAMIVHSWFQTNKAKQQLSANFYDVDSNEHVLRLHSSLT
jgi:excinuclease UvrABC nuclease subunit